MCLHFAKVNALVQVCSGCDMHLLQWQVDPAAFEISGHIIFKRGQDYEVATQAGIWRLLEYASLSEQDFLATARLALDF